MLISIEMKNEASEDVFQQEITQKISNCINKMKRCAKGYSIDLK